MTIEYDDENYRTLLMKYKSLSTYEEVANWDELARKEVDRIIEVLQKIDSELTQKYELLEQAKNEYSQKSFLQRLVASHKSEAEIATTIARYRSYQVSLEEISAKLQEMIDFTPNTPDEKKDLLKELRLRKKEIQTEKRELAANMKAIRNEARVQSVHAGSVFTSYIYLPKIATFQRRQIRYAREAELRPNEDAKSAIERQLIQIEKNILWVERF